MMLGDLLAAAESLRSFDREDVESAAGKKRVIDLVSGYLADYVAAARAVNTETEDMFGAEPASAADLLRLERSRGGATGGARFSVNPNLRAEIDAALNTDRSKGEVVKGAKRVVFGRSQRLFPALGLPDGDIYTKAYALRKIAADHKLTAEQIASAPGLMEEPAAVFDDNGKGYVFLTEAIAPDRNGVDAPVMFYIHPDGEGNYIASAYSRTEDAEAKYVNLANARKILYLDKNRIARLPLRGEALSSLITFSAGDGVVTPEGLTEGILPQSGGGSQGGAARFSVSPVYTGSAADYANRSRKGGEDDGPSLKKIGSGEGSQVYGWGLYGSTVRGVAEGYAHHKESDLRIDDKPYTEQIDNGRVPKDHVRLLNRLDNVIGWNIKDGMVRNAAIEAALTDSIWTDEERTILDKYKGRLGYNSKHLYEQTFFTDRAPGDESHLLKWYEPVTEEQKQWIADELNKSIDDPEMKWIVTENGLKPNNPYAIESKFKTGEEAYQFATIQAAVIAKSKNGREFPRLASELLARAGIDGVKYPVDSFGGNVVKDGDEAGWNYVSFRDDNIRVDHKWTDGQVRYSVSVTPQVRRDTTVEVEGMTREKADAALRALAGRDLKNDETGIVAQVNSVQRRKILSGVAVQKSIDNGFSAEEHNAAASIMEKLWKHASLGKSDSDKNGDPFVKSIKRFVAPVRMGDKDAYAYLTVKESNMRGHRIYSIELEKLEALARKLGAISPAAQNASDIPEGTARIISQDGGAAQGGAARFSVAVTPEEDAAYMDAVKRGDTEAARRMVREAAEKSGYSTFGLHGTKGEFTVFDKKRIGSANDEGWLGRGFYFWDKGNRLYAEQYAHGGKVMEVMLSMEEPYLVDKSEMNRLIDAAEKHDVKTIEDFTEQIKAEGYDSVIDGDGQMLVFEPNQIKSSAPVTYDDAGNVMPLSERFNPKSEDVRYSVAQTATPQFKRWFGDWEKDSANASKVVDEDGKPLVVWHGDMDPSFTVFDKGQVRRGTGFWFAKEQGEAASYALDAEPRAFYLDIRNPAREADLKGRLLDDYHANGGAGASWKAFIWDGHAAEFLRSRGYDGLEFEGKYIAFEPTQIKSATDNTGSFSPANPDIRHSIVSLGDRKVAVLDRKDEIAKIDLNDRKSLHDYLVGKVGQELMDGFFVGEDLPNEYIYSEDAKGNNKRKRKAKAKLATSLDEAAQSSAAPTAEDAEHKRREGGKYYRRAFAFAVPSGLDGAFRAYTADLVSYMKDGTERLYDVVNIEDAPGISADLAQLPSRIAQEGTSRIPAESGAASAPEGTADNIPNPADEIKRDPEAFARKSIVSRMEEGSEDEKESALVAFVAERALRHGPKPKRIQTIGRIGLELGLKVVDTDRIIRKGEALAERVRGTVIERAVRNGDAATAVALLARESDIDRAVDM